MAGKNHRIFVAARTDQTFHIRRVFEKPVAGLAGQSADKNVHFLRDRSQLRNR